MPMGAFAAETKENTAKKVTSTSKITMQKQEQLKKEKAAKLAKEKAAKLAKEKAAKLAKEKAAKLAKEKAAKLALERAEADKKRQEEALALASAKTSQAPQYQTIKFNAKDGLMVTADLYPPQDGKVSDTLIIAFHRSQWSRGEYSVIAPYLTKKHYAVLAVDQRSGDNIKGITNETAALAASQKLPQEWADAQTDVEAAIDYATATLGYKKIVLWGSSYSTSLVLGSAVKYKDIVTGVLCFSPDNYVTVGNLSSSANAALIKVPTFIAVAPFEATYAEPIFEALKANNDKNQYVVIAEDNLHGSSMLWSGNDLPFSKALWEQLMGFMETLNMQTSN